MLYVRVSLSSYSWVLLWENRDLGIWYIIGIWPRDLRYARVWWQSWLNSVLGIRYKGSSKQIPWSSSFKEESWCGISDEEVWDGSRVGCVGFSGGYRSVNWDEIKSYDNSKDFFEAVAKSFISHECGWLGIVELFSILHMLAIN